MKAKNVNVCYNGEGCVMKIGILQTAYKKASEYGAYYNVQELGLARALSMQGHDVILYKAVDGEGIVRTENYDKLKIMLVSTKFHGINGMFDISVLDETLDVLVYFCDTQLIVPKVYKWCRSKGIMFVPYVGVVRSHSENILKRFAKNFMTRKNISIYRKTMVLCKTPDLYDELAKLRCRDLKLFPVGLDESVMAEGMSVSGDLAKKLSAIGKHPLRMLFVGRMEEEKQPLEMVHIIDEMLKVNPDICVSMIGDGYLYDEVENALDKVSKAHDCPDGNINLIRKVPYEDMHIYYSNSDININLNRVEILGMSILESMYYGCPVIAIDAPGPRFVIGQAEGCGIIASDLDDIIAKIKAFEAGEYDHEAIRLAAARRVHGDFVWSAIAQKLVDLVDENWKNYE